MMNIAGLNPVEDANYRYKMPRILAKVEGRGNGIKTVVINMKEVAQALHRMPAEVTKFFGTELGAQTTYREETERAVVNGAHTAPALQTSLCRYIQGFVLCPSCGLPETAYKIKGGVIYQKCDACGEKSMCDMSHKLTTFIINTHKKAAKEGKGTKEAKEKKKKDRSKADAEDDDLDEDGGAEGEEKEKKKKKKKDKEEKEKKKKKKREKREKASEAGSSDGDGNGMGTSNGKTSKQGSSDDDEGEGEEEEEEEEGEVVARLDNLAVEDATALAGAIGRLQHFLNSNPSAGASQILEEIRMIATFSALPVEERPFLFVQAAFGPEAGRENAIRRHQKVLKGLMLSVDEEMYQRRLIGVMEHLCAVTHAESLHKWFPVLLKQLYDEGVVDEEVFLEWAEEEGPTEFTRREVTPAMVESLRKEAGKFVTWLTEAASDSEEESGGEESEEE
ncbi:eukaryotic translation initiation factor 5 [Nannochloropsis gaditana]|uniref:Eukaryotic translation initiation factor 5 n=1 Tax=Nannochloropsis gaditana TaxID=72520 RepID=W7U5E6_9STRA|nr:eukaryotic translation initiation factor 5 [Nannochloropsis gaditana]